jgi:multidrug efflux pump subunit AcrA (membrane-fusion protein)
MAIASPRDKSLTISVAGRLEPLRRISHSLSVGGFVETVHVKLGDRVREGQALVTITRDAPGDSYRPVVLTSRIDGRVAELALSPGAEARAGAAAVTVLDDSAYLLRVALSDRDAHRVASLAGPDILARSADGARLSGRVLSVSTEPDYATGLFSATIRVAAQDGARIGLAVFMDLPVAALRGIFIRSELLVRRFGRSLAWVLDADDTVRVAPLVLGNAFGDEYLVSSGLASGTRYLTRLSGKEREGMPLEELIAIWAGSS